MIERCFKTRGHCEFNIEELHDQVFVGIPYHYPYTDVYEFGVRPALEELRLRPWIAKEDPGSRDIYCKMCEGLQRSSAAIIDISEPNANVHFELGLLAGTSKPLILIKQKTAEVSTDLKGMETLEYGDAKELCQLLIKQFTLVVKSGKTYPKLAGHATYPEFYRDCSVALGQSSQKVDLTHIRDEPPQDFTGVTKWYNDVIKWCDEHPYGKVRRIISISNARMFEWAKELSESIKKLPNHNFDVRVCRWEADFPAINMAIFDRKRIFIALTSFGTSETTGVQIADTQIADYFVDYFNNVWGKSEDLNIFLEKFKKEEIHIDE